MFRVFATLSIIISTLTNVNSQSTILKSKNIPRNLLKSYIEDHKGVLVDIDASGLFRRYHLDDGTVLVENSIEKYGILYLNRSEFYRQINKMEQVNASSRLKNCQEEIFGLPKNADSIVGRFLAKLDMPNEVAPVKLDLKLVDSSIQTYRSKNDNSDEFLLDLIIFCGEYIKEVKGGTWVIRADHKESHLMHPMFIDSDRRDYYFWLNVRIVREILERNRVSISSIISDALTLPQLSLK